MDLIAMEEVIKVPGVEEIFSKERPGTLLSSILPKPEYWNQVVGGGRRELWERCVIEQWVKEHQV